MPVTALPGSDPGRNRMSHNPTENAVTTLSPVSRSTRSETGSAIGTLAARSGLGGAVDQANRELRIDSDRTRQEPLQPGVPLQLAGVASRRYFEWARRSGDRHWRYARAVEGE